MNPLEQAITTSQRLRPHTKAQYLRHVRAFVSFAGGDPRAWTGAAVERFRDAELGRGVSVAFVNTELSAVKKASERWSKLGNGPDFAAAAELLPVLDAKTREALPFDRAQDLVAACEGGSPIDLRDMAIVVFLARTGIRREGLVGITFEDVSGTEVVVTLKGGKRHKLVMDAETREVMGAWMRWLKRHGVETGPVFRGIRSKVETDGAVGDGLGVTGLHAVIKRRGARAKMPGLHAHILRHSFISWSRALEIPDWRIALSTGHKVLTAPGVPTVPQLGSYTTDPRAHEGAGSWLPPLRRK